MRVGRWVENSVGWTAAMMADSMAGQWDCYLAELTVVRMVGLMAARMAARMVELRVGWLVGCLVDWTAEMTVGQTVVPKVA